MSYIPACQHPAQRARSHCRTPYPDDACDDTITIAHLNFLHYGLKKRLEMLKKGVELITEIDRARKAVLN